MLSKNIVNICFLDLRAWSVPPAADARQSRDCGPRHAVSALPHPPVRRAQARLRRTERGGRVAKCYLGWISFREIMALVE